MLLTAARSLKTKLRKVHKIMKIISSHIFSTLKQSHYREVAWWDIFMEQELRFGQDMGRMANFPAFIASKYFDL